MNAEEIVAWFRKHQTGRFGLGTATWDDAIARFGEDAINAAMDAGYLCEPFLGILQVI